MIIKIPNYLNMLFVKLITRKAYCGYKLYVSKSDRNEHALSFAEFKNFEHWKIKLCFRIYLKDILKRKGVLPYDVSNTKLFLKYLNLI